MSFDLFFQPCRFAASPVEEQNLRTGVSRTVLPDEPLSTGELEAVLRVLKRANAHRPDGFGFYVLELDDGGVAQIFASELAEHCMVASRRMTASLIQFLFDFLEAGKWVMIPAMEDLVAITTAPECLKGIPDGFPKIVVCNSAKELGILLAKGVQEWEKYRDQIVKKSD